MINGTCDHGSRWVKVNQKWWKVVIAPGCECKEPETLFDLVGESDLDRDCEEINDKIGAEEWMDDPEDEDWDDDYADGYADPPADAE